VLAHALKFLVAPTSIKNHTSMDSANKLIWDEAYNEEYDGFVSLLTWEVVSEAQYHQLSKGKHALHTMVIATIQYNEHNHPKRAKYQWCWETWTTILGQKKIQLHLYYHNWNSDC
jgi:hypothetical protein